MATTTFSLIVSIVLPFPEYHVWNHRVCNFSRLVSFTWHYMFKFPPCLFLDSLFLLQNNSPLYRCNSLYRPPGRHHSGLQTPYVDRQVLLCHMWKEVLILNHTVYIYVIYSSIIQKVSFKKASGFHSSSLYLLILKGIGNLEILILTLKLYRMYCYFTFKAANNIMI